MSRFAEPAAALGFGLNSALQDISHRRRLCMGGNQSLLESVSPQTGRADKSHSQKMIVVKVALHRYASGADLGLEFSLSTHEQFGKCAHLAQQSTTLMSDKVPKVPELVIRDGRQNMDLVP